MIENSHNTTLTFLFGAVLTVDFKYWAVLTENLGRFGLGPFSIRAVLTGISVCALMQFVSSSIRSKYPKS